MKIKILEILLCLISSILFIDYIGFCAWILSGQFPADNIYLGSITCNLLKLITN